LDNLLVAEARGHGNFDHHYPTIDDRTFLGFGVETLITSLIIVAWVAAEHLSHEFIRARRRPHGRLIWLSFAMRTAILVIGLVIAGKRGWIAEPAAWEIGLTILLVEALLRVSIGVRH